MLHLWGHVVEAGCNIEVVLAFSATAIPYAIESAVLCFTWRFQVQCFAYLFSALAVDYAFWCGSCIILLLIVGVFTYEKWKWRAQIDLDLRLLERKSVWSIYLHVCCQLLYTAESTQHAAAEGSILCLQNLCSWCKSTIVQVTARRSSRS